MYLSTGSHHGNPAAEIFQLPYVSRPGQIFQKLNGLGAQYFRFHFQLFGCLGQKVHGELCDIFAPVCQFGDVNPDDVETVEQILAEQVLLDELFEVLMSGRNDAHIDFDRGVPAHAIEFTIREHAQ